MYDISEQIERFTREVLADALRNAEARYWSRRGFGFKDALPRAGDYLGQASPEALEARRERLEAKAAACRRHADLLLERDGVA